MPECIQMLLQKGCIDDISIMREGEMASLACHLEGLDVLHSAHVGGGIADVAYAIAALQPVQVGLHEDFLHQPGTFVQADDAIFTLSGDSAALLATVLEALQAEEREA